MNEGKKIVFIKEEKEKGSSNQQNKKSLLQNYDVAKNAIGF